MDHDTAPDMAALLQRTRSASLSLVADAAEVAGFDAPESLDPETRLVAYRIVQEALTNVLRHAPGAEAAVTLRRDGDRVHVIVRNGPPTGSGSGIGTGRGLVGLRERASGHGGELRWGHCPNGGFEVHARLPARRVEGAGR
jgi:signal transduction histidine kinase